MYYSIQNRLMDYDLPNQTLITDACSERGKVHQYNKEKIQQ
jgi:hypothetical protein